MHTIRCRGVHFVSAFADPAREDAVKLQVNGEGVAERV
jgi:hypothetical protein